MAVIQRISRAIQSGKWAILFYEFMLIFLAVLGGLWAENWRESAEERKRVKQHLRAMVSDLKNDSLTFAQYESRSQRACDHINYIIATIQTSNSIEQQVSVYTKSRELGTIINQLPLLQTKTYDELVQDGDMRLIPNESLADSISNYYTGYLAILTQQRAVYEILTEDFFVSAKHIFEPNAYHQTRRMFIGEVAIADVKLAVEQGGYLRFTPNEIASYKHSLSYFYGHIYANRRILLGFEQKRNQLQKQLAAANAKL